VEQDFFNLMHNNHLRSVKNTNSYSAFKTRACDSVFFIMSSQVMPRLPLHGPDFDGKIMDSHYCNLLHITVHLYISFTYISLISEEPSQFCYDILYTIFFNQTMFSISWYRQCPGHNRDSISIYVNPKIN
jgi:hypothetical protein